jgi:hypothetical protein
MRIAQKHIEARHISDSPGAMLDHATRTRKRNPHRHTRSAVRDGSRQRGAVRHA